MNTQGWQRGLMAKNMPVDKFFNHVTSCIGREFEKDTKASTEGETFIFTIENYVIRLDKDKADELQHKGAFALDRHILEELENQGFKLDKSRSQYIRYVFSLFSPRDKVRIIPARQGIRRNFTHLFNSGVPKGDLFYPCCGRDTYEPIKLFLGLVDDFHFADIHKAVLPLPECGVEILSKSKNQERILDERRRVGVISQSIVKTAKQENLTGYKEIGRGLKQNFRINLGDVVYRNIGKKETWVLNNTEGTETRIFSHQSDAALTFLTRDKISVFFYRGDSIGEGGSGQWWLGPNLFNLVLNKLVNGGIIITDGSNPDPRCLDVPWKELWDYENKPNDFECLGRRFTCLGELRQMRRGFVWRVERIK